MRQDETQRIISKANINSSYFIECTDIIQALLIKLLEIAKCGKNKVRRDEIWLK